MIWVAVAIAGGLGALARDRTARALSRTERGPLIATALVNLVGAHLLGILVGAEADRDLLLILGAGLLGGLTTFSTWMVQAAGSSDRAVRAIVIVLPLTAGVAAGSAGIWLGRWLAA